MVLLILYSTFKILVGQSVMMVMETMSLLCKTEECNNLKFLTICFVAFCVS